MLYREHGDYEGVDVPECHLSRFKEESLRFAQFESGFHNAAFDGGNIARVGRNLQLCDMVAHFSLGKFGFVWYFSSRWEYAQNTKPGEKRNWRRSGHFPSSRAPHKSPRSTVCWNSVMVTDPKPRPTLESAAQHCTDFFSSRHHHNQSPPPKLTPRSSHELRM